LDRRLVDFHAKHQVALFMLLFDPQHTVPPLISLLAMGFETQLFLRAAGGQKSPLYDLPARARKANNSLQEWAYLLFPMPYRMGAAFQKLPGLSFRNHEQHGS
jgi:hypothetical protein